MALIQLSAGQYTTVDDKDYVWLSQWKWSVSKRVHGYHAARRSSRSTGQKCIYMHRVILDAPPNREVDHINGNGLDNRRKNLRLATKVLNGLNRHHRPRRCKLPQGVERTKQGRFHARIMVRGQRQGLGTYDDPNVASQAYQKARAHAISKELRRV